MLTTYVLLVVNKGVETASVALIVLALVSFFIYKLIFRGVSKSRKKFFVYRHYLLLGDQVLHYQNVDRAILSPSRGIIQLHDRVHNRNIMIDRTKFICVTKKSDKIKIRQAEKFQKTLQALVPALQADNPQLRIERA